MDYRIKETSNQIDVYFSGRIGFTDHKEFRTILKDLKSKTFGSCVFDLSDVDMVDSAGLGMFLLAWDQSNSDNWALNVRGAKGHVEQMLKLTNIGELLS